MSEQPNTDELALEFSGLTIRISKTPDRRVARTENDSEASFTVISEVPHLGALAGPSSGPCSAGSAGYSSPRSGVVEATPPAQAWSLEWERDLLAAATPADFEQLDLAPVTHLVRNLRGWTPLARLGRALRAGVLAKRKLHHQPGAYQLGPDVPLDNRIYVVLQAPEGRSIGWTDHYQTFRASVEGKFSRFHADAVCHSFASRTEAEAYCIGAGRPWPDLLPRLR